MGLVTEITYMSHVLHIYIYVNWMDLPVDLPEANRANLLASWSGNPHNLEDLNLWQPLRWNLSYLQALILAKAGNLHLRCYHTISNTTPNKRWLQPPCGAALHGSLHTRGTKQSRITSAC
jgi:hypothetical protein